MAYRTLADLTALELEEPLDRFLVHAEQTSHGAVPKRRLLLDQRLDRRYQGRIDLQRLLARPVIHRPARHIEPTAKLAEPDLFILSCKFLLERED